MFSMFRFLMGDKSVVCRIIRLLILILTIYVRDTGKYGELVVVWIDDKDVDMSMISHEAFHVSMNILSELGIKFHADNQEPIAYMVGWCARCISDVVSGEVGISD